MDENCRFSITDFNESHIEQALNLLGVDYETMNPTAAQFWEKYFRRYTLSMVRRID